MCRRCKSVKVLSEENFRLETQNREGKKTLYLKKVCRACEYSARTEWGRKNHEHVNASRRSSLTFERRLKHSLSRYGLTLDQYDILLESQNGVCKICKNPETRKHQSGRVKKLSVDHDHDTMRVRGLLCSRCNAGIGLLGEKSSALFAAAEYLKGHGR